MSGMEFGSHIPDIKPILRLRFGVLGDKEIISNSAIGTRGVETTDLYQANKEPVIGGLLDPRMGTTDTTTICSTCGLISLECPGHPGHILLVEKMFNIQYINYVVDILNKVCPRCSKIFFPPDNKKARDKLFSKQGKERFDMLKVLTKGTKSCKADGCNGTQHKIKFDSKELEMSISIVEDNVMEGGKKKKKTRNIYMSPLEVYNRLKAISDEHVQYMGLATRPENLMYGTAFPVIPNPARPSAKGDFLGEQIREDGLTKFANEILKANIKVLTKKEKVGVDSLNNQKEIIKPLQFYLAVIIDSSIKAAKKNNNPGQTKDIISRLSGKDGIVRSNLMGKRVQYSSRSVIKPNPSVAHDEISIPEKVASTLTMPVHVVDSNLEEMNALVARKKQYPGANFVLIKRPNKTYSLKNLSFAGDIKLKVGDIVERHIITGDVVMLNRQPTLHKQSMMAHKIIVNRDPNVMTFDIATGLDTAYGCDFDGDEMNGFYPRSGRTAYEITSLSSVGPQMILWKNSGPAIGLSHDYISMGYELTQDGVRVDWRTAMNLMASTNKFKNLKIDKGKSCSGKELFSLLIPPDISLSSKSIDKTQNNIIRGGKLVEGHLNRNLLGAKTNSIHHSVYASYGPDEAILFLKNAQNLLNNFGMIKGFSISMENFAISDDAKNKIQDYIGSIYTKIGNDLTLQEINSEGTTKETHEIQIYNILNSIRPEISKIVLDSIQKEGNPIYTATNSGSKGDVSHLVQPIAVVGLQDNGGKLVDINYNGRSGPYFHKYDESPGARAFILNAFNDGMTWPETIEQCSSGRQGAIASAIGTADTGYLQRKLVKTLEDVIICHDGSVRTASGGLLQLVYGYTGFDPSKQHSYFVNMVNLNNDKIKQRYCYKDSKVLTFNMINDMKYSVIDQMTRATLKYTVLQSKFQIPLSINSLIEGARFQEESNKEPKMTPADEQYIMDQLMDILSPSKTYLLCLSKKDKQNKNCTLYRDEMILKTILKVILIDSLAPKIIIEDLKLSKRGFDELVKKIIQNINLNMLYPGVLVGIIAGQCIGEIISQANLKSIHKAGSGFRALKTTGAPRIIELIGVSKHPKAPQMTIYGDKTARYDKVLMTKIASALQHVSIKDVIDIDKTMIVYDRSNSYKDYDGIVNTNNSPDYEKNHILIRLEMDKISLIEKEVTLIDIKTALYNWWDLHTKKSSKTAKDKFGKKDDKKIIKKICGFAVLINDDNDKTPVVHIRFSIRDDDDDKANTDTIRSFYENIILNFKLKGIPGINKVIEVNTEMMFDYNRETGEKEQKDQHIIVTSGSNLLNIRLLKYVDLTKSLSDNIIEVYEVFGIEIARAVLIKELKEAFGEVDINHQHIEVLADFMSFTGSLVSADRHGMIKNALELLSKVSFEKTVEHFTTAAVFGEVDFLNGLSGLLMVGQTVKAGTNFTKILVDINKLNNFEMDVVKPNKTYEQKGNIARDILMQNTTNDGFLPDDF